MSDWCANCLEAPSTTRRGGYDCCELCAEQHDLMKLRSSK